MNYTVLQLRGGSEAEHLSGNGTGFIGEAKEVTVDTTNWTLRVHDGKTIGGHKLAHDKEIKANEVFFDDGETLQYKLDNGKLGNGSGETEPPVDPEPTPPTHEGPKILTISSTNELSNGSATITYYVEDKEHNTFTHSFSKDNGINFNEIKPKGSNPYTFDTKGLALGSNICALRIDDGVKAVDKYFIVEIPSPSADTAPTISDLYTSDITTTGFKVHYKATDKENHSIKHHKLSLDNGYSYSEFYPNIQNGVYTINVENVNVGTTYFCRLKVTANGLDSNPYGFQVTTLTQATIKNPYITDGKDVYKLEVLNNNIIPVKCNEYIENACNEILINNNNSTYRLKIVDNVLSVTNA